MSNLKLCPGDPVVSELRKVFKANILQIPEERIVPLTVLISTQGTVRFLGHIRSLLKGSPLEISSEDIMESAMPTLGNRRSGFLEANGDLNEGGGGFKLLSGFLSGMSGVSMPNLSIHLKGAKTLRFYFPEVRRNYIEIARIGKLLQGRSFDSANLLSETLLDPKTIVRLIDSVITATDFEIESGAEDEDSLEIDPVLLKGLAEAKIEVIAKDTKHLRFRSPRRLAFAFTCVNISISANGSIRAIAPSMDRVGSPQLSGSRDYDRGLEDHVLLTRVPELINVES